MGVIRSAEYFYQEYRRSLSLFSGSSEYAKAVKKVTSEFCSEALELVSLQEAEGDDDAVADIVKAQNQKWNSLVKKFEIREGISPLKKDGINQVFAKAYPQIADRLGVIVEKEVVTNGQTN